MREKALKLLGLMRRASAISIGEDSAGDCVKAGKAKLLCLAQDASENARMRAERFVFGHRTLLVTLPFEKEELARELGVSGCSMLAISDLGFANAFLKLLCTLDASFEESSRELQQRQEKAERRKRETYGLGKNKNAGKRRMKA